MEDLKALVIIFGFMNLLSHDAESTSEVRKTCRNTISISGNNPKGRIPEWGGISEEEELLFPQKAVTFMSEVLSLQIKSAAS
jgi:hypothetical protein